MSIPIDDDYSPAVLAKLNEVLAKARPGEWVELAICPGPFGCILGGSLEGLLDGLGFVSCTSCRSIITKRAG